VCVAVCVVLYLVEGVVVCVAGCFAVGVAECVVVCFSVCVTVCTTVGVVVCPTVVVRNTASGDDGGDNEVRLRYTPETVALRCEGADTYLVFTTGMLSVDGLGTGHLLDANVW